MGVHFQREGELLLDDGLHLFQDGRVGGGESFAAFLSYLGSYGNAANTVVFPLTVVALAVAVMVGDGCCAFVSISLGRGDRESAKRSVGNAVVMSLAASLVLTAVYLLFQTEIIAMFGGTVNEETFQYSREYFFYITLAGAIANI
ncbi:MAG TPA: hypothetical protein H9839_04475, partial [Candidatus Intestinimonas stercorigallinarum]|nr:hypothetical protein [Candidatus Intestinimonas stercorigallinarum]